mgnify:CR=1 FL=1
MAKILNFEEMKRKMYGFCDITPEQKEKIEIRLKEQSAKKDANIGIKSDRDLPMKCDLCGKMFTMGQLEHDTNFGYVCKKCENRDTC